MGWLTALGGIAGSLINSVLDNEREDHATDSIVEASDRAQGMLTDAEARANSYLEPYRASGGAALNQRNALLGLPQAQVTAAPATPTAQPAATNPATGQPYSGPNWSDYVARYPDIQQYWNDNPSVRNTFPTIEALAEHHYNSFGQQEGRTVNNYGPPAGSTPAATPAGTVPATVGVGGGAAQPTTGGTNPLAEIAPAADPIAAAQDSAYDTFLNSGHARSMLETTDADFDRLVAAFGAGGSSLSGSAIGALNDRNRRNTNTAFTQYDNALAGLSNMGAQTAGTMGRNALNSALYRGELEVGQGETRGSSYRDRSNPFQEAVGAAARGGFF